MLYSNKNNHKYPNTKGISVGGIAKEKIIMSGIFFNLYSSIFSLFIVNSYILKFSCANLRRKLETSKLLGSFLMIFRQRLFFQFANILFQKLLKKNDSRSESISDRDTFLLYDNFLSPNDVNAFTRSCKTLTIKGEDWDIEIAIFLQCTNTTVNKFYVYFTDVRSETVFC